MFHYDNTIIITIFIKLYFILLFLSIGNYYKAFYWGVTVGQGTRVYRAKIQLGLKFWGGG